MSRLTRWLLAITVIFALATFGVQRGRKLTREANERAKTERSQKEFQKIKAGGDYALVFSDDLIVMLANDADCIQNLKTVHLFGDNLAAPGYGQIQKLANVHRILIDECSDVDSFLPLIRNMPSVDYLYFHVIAMTDKIQMQLASIPTLKKVRYDTISQKDAEALARKLPNVTVEIDDDTTGKPIQVSSGLP